MSLVDFQQLIECDRRTSHINIIIHEHFRCLVRFNEDALCSLLDGEALMVHGYQHSNNSHNAHESAISSI